MKQKTLIPLIVFLLGICLVGIILYKVDSHETAQNHTTALLNATTYGERIKNEITLYTSCCNLNKGIYYYTTYENHQISAVDMHVENLDATELIRYTPITGEQIHWQNK